MKNPIPHTNLWVTRSLEDIQADIEGLPKQHKALVYSYVMAVLNACHDLVEQEMTNETV